MFFPVQGIKGFSEAVTGMGGGEGEGRRASNRQCSQCLLFWSLFLATPERADLSFLSASHSLSPLFSQNDNVTHLVTFPDVLLPTVS